MELYLLIVLPIFASLLLYFMPTRISSWLTVILHLGVLAVTLDIFRRVRFGGEILTTGSGTDFLGILLYCDLTASVFLILAAFLFLCVFLYTNLPERVGKLYSFLITVLEGLIMLIFLSRDLFNLYVAIEVAAIVCAILIMFKRESRSIYDGLTYLLINITGMLFFLLGIGMLYRQVGALDLDSISAALLTRDAEQLLLPYALLMTGACLKCALFPMHFWLPLAHGTPGAPTAVSAILSGIYMKSGIYLFLRIQNLFSPVIDTAQFFFWLGVLTALAGIIMAICQSDIKLILAYHTISQIGLIVAGLSAGHETVQAGAMLHIINHAVFKSLLFLAAGILISKYKTRNLYKIRGVMRSLPLVGIAVACGILGITGAPFFNGSISKYMLAQVFGRVEETCFLLINFGTILSFVKFGQILFGPKQDLGFRYDIYSTVVVLVLSGLCLITGLLGEPLLHLLFQLEQHIGFESYCAKGAVWALSFLAAYFVYKKGLSRSKQIRAGIDLNLPFNSIVMCIGASFVVLLGVGYFGIVR